MEYTDGERPPEAALREGKGSVISGMNDIEQWLADIGLDQYGPLFRAQEIDLIVLPDLRDGDLKELGIPLGHRKRLLRAISEIQARDAGARDQATTDTGTSIPKTSAEAERRQITVLFCDLVGSTELSTRLDPEDMSELLRTYRSCCAGTIARWDGYIAKYMGDGVLAYFGWPRSHEDDAERAVRAGLELVAAVGRLDLGEGNPLAARVGIATGQVVAGDLIGEGDAQERNVVGDTPNLAARLQSLASPNAIVIAPDTRRLLGSLFEFRDLGPLAVKGFARPVSACEVLRASAAESRFEALRAQQTPLVGREEGIGVLLRRWQQAKEGEGQVVLLSGEPGIGKSRVGATLLERLADEPHVRLRYFCSPHHSTSPMHPFISQLKRAANFEPDDPPRIKLDNLETLFAPSTKNLAEDVQLMAELLAIPTEERYPPLKLSPQQKKERTLAALLDNLESLAAKSTVLMIYEDVHWVDPTSLELLERMVDVVERLPVLLVITFRPEFQPSWVGLAHVTLHPLNKLNRRESAKMLDRMTAGKPLPREVAEQIIKHTDGVPLFLEELTKTVLEGALLEEQADRYVLTGPLPPLAIPTSLQASLMARLDRLASLKDVAQIGAAIGREFSYELLAAVAGHSEHDLQSALDQLVTAGLIFRRGTPPRVSLQFKHALVQDAAYSTLLRSRRQELHARIARVLEEAFPDIVETQPELLAHHCTQAGLTEQAIDYWQRAGERALTRSANLEASRHFGHGIEMIKSLSYSPAHTRREFRLYLGLGPANRAIKGHAAPETLDAFTRARDLFDADTSLPEQMVVFYGLWGVHFVRAEIEAARKVAEQALLLMARNADAASQAHANRLMGETLFALGEFVEARQYLQRAIAFCDSDRATHTDLRFSFDCKVGALAFLAWVLCALGHLEQAGSAATEAFTLSVRLEHPLTSSMALVGMVFLAEFRRDTADLREHADAQVALCAEHGITLFGIWASFSQGLARSWSGDPHAGIVAMRAAMVAAESAHEGMWRPMRLGFLAEVHAGIGERELALALLDEAIALVATTKEGNFEAELHRMRGEILLAQDKAAAEASFERALSIARHQSAKLWELRAAVSLSRLWRDQGRRDDARSLLAPVYGWFTEGFATPDLQAARELLDTLHGA
jgi:class 3 adenylate cyclase/predicted ATPase